MFSPFFPLQSSSKSLFMLFIIHINNFHLLLWVRNNFIILNIDNFRLLVSSLFMKKFKSVDAIHYYKNLIIMRLKNEIISAHGLTKARKHNLSNFQFPAAKKTTLRK